MIVKRARDILRNVDRERLLKTLTRMIRINSVNPRMVDGAPGETRIAGLVADELKSLGLRVKKQLVEKGRHNMIAVLPGRLGRPRLMLNGHLDTVGAERMRRPFTPLQVGSRLYGRGACDMKGPIAAMIEATRGLIDSNTSLDGDLVLAFVVDEEYQSAGTKKLVKTEKVDAAIVGEPTSLQVSVAHRGFVWLQVEFQGKAAHGSVPEQGIDAIDHASRFIGRLDRLKQAYRTRRHRLLGHPLIHNSTVHGGVGWSTIPDRCVVRLERRTLPGESPRQALLEVNRVLTELKHDHGSLNAAARVVFHGPSMQVSPREPVIRTLTRAVRRVTGRKARVTGQPFWTDAALFVNKAKTPAVLYGPGNVNVAHSDHEHVSIPELVTAAKVYADASYVFLTNH